MASLMKTVVAVSSRDQRTTHYEGMDPLNSLGLANEKTLYNVLLFFPRSGKLQGIELTQIAFLWKRTLKADTIFVVSLANVQEKVR